MGGKLYKVVFVIYFMKGVIDSFNIVKDLPMARWKVVTRHEDLKMFEFPYFLKADVSGHKTDLGAVIRCDNLDDAEKKLRELHKKFPKNKIIAQETFEGVEMIVGIKSDEVFGKLLVVGFGGIFAEVKKDVTFRSLPVSEAEIKGMILDLEGKDVFRVRGKSYDLGKFVILIEEVVRLGARLDIKELDLNPVIVGEKRSLVIDARVELE